MTSALATCRACPRLVAHLDQVRSAYPEYHCAPVPASGSARARLLIVGLAPGRHGANRTGRPFVGDDSGRFLFDALARAGLASEPDPAHARLRGVRITNAVKCLPPGNKPQPGEVNRCRSFLVDELATLMAGAPRRPRVVLTLGRIAHQSVARAVAEIPGTCGVHVFGHDGVSRVRRSCWVISSYHPSRQNTRTGRLTEDMFAAVLGRVVATLDDQEPASYSSPA